MSWTYSYQIPPTRGSSGLTFATSVFNDVWIFHGSNLTIFNTETHEMTTKDVPFLKNFGDDTEMCASHNNKIYLFEGRNYLPYIVRELNPITMKFTHVINIDLYREPMFWNNNMYLITDNSADRRFCDLVTIDLDTKQVINRMTFRYPSMQDKKFMIYDGELFTAGHDNGLRFVAVLKDGAFQKVCENNHNMGDLSSSHKLSEGLSFCSFNATLICHEKYDFEKNRWMAEVIPNGWQSKKSEHLIQSSVDIDGKLYVILCNKVRSVEKFELRIFERLPSLTDICLLNLADDLVASIELNKVEKMQEVMPFDLRPRLENMYEWKAHEHEKGQKWKVGKSNDDSETDEMSDEELNE